MNSRTELLPFLRSMLLLALTIAMALIGVRSLDSAEPPKPAPDYSAELPRFPPVEPDKALTTFKIQSGFKMELVAAEPLVASPVAVCWDERGRMFVVEMRGYSERRDEKLSRVRLLTDTNDDGVYDDAKVFADDLLWPTAIICWQGGVFVGDAPDILYLKDTDGDGKADERKRVYTGFGTQNVQGLLNTFLWGLDNRIHGATSSNGGDILYVGAEAKDQKAISLRGRDFSFDPRNLADIRPESGGGQHGITFDDWGRKFVCSNSDHAQQIMIEDRYIARNPSLAPPAPRVSIAADGPQAPVFRASPIEPWRILRTRLRVAGQVPGPIERGGKPAGYFTGATGITIIRGDAFDDATRGTLVVGDVGSNLIHRKRLRLEGLKYVAERIDKESELVASIDTWFRPAQFANGPDGGLTIIDVYREVIEHPASLPPDIKRHLDLDSGRDRGRIYRLVPEGYKFRPTQRLDQATTEELISLLGHRNAWHRETAARLLYERQPTTAAEQLVLVLESPGVKPIAKVQALYSLAGQGEQIESGGGPLLLTRAMHDAHPRVREHAYRLAEIVLKTGWSEAEEILTDKPRPDARMLAIELLKLTEEDRQAQLQLALSLQLVGARDRSNRLAILRRGVKDSYLRWASMPNVSITSILNDESLPYEPQLRPELLLLAEQVGQQAAKSIGKRDNHTPLGHLVFVIRGIDGLHQNDRILSWRLAQAVERGLGAQKERVLGTRDLADDLERWNRIRLEGLQAAVKVSCDRSAPIASRGEAIVALAGAGWAPLRSVSESLLVPQEVPEAQLAILQVLAERTEVEAASIILVAWSNLSPAVRRAAGSVLVGRKERAEKLLAAIEQGKFKPDELEPAQRELLRSHPNAAIRQQAAKYFEPRTNAERQAVLDAYKPALEMKGDPARGKAHFAKSCSACHRLENVGTEVGPNLAAMRNRGPEAILLNVLDPNREVNPQYLTYIVTTVDGRTLTGLVAAETATSVTLRQADGRTEAILRANIDEFRGPSLSFMPDGLEKQLDPQAMADLLAYLMSVK